MHPFLSLSPICFVYTSLTQLHTSAKWLSAVSLLVVFASQGLQHVALTTPHVSQLLKHTSPCNQELKSLTGRPCPSHSLATLFVTTAKRSSLSTSMAPTMLPDWTWRINKAEESHLQVMFKSFPHFPTSQNG